MHLVLTAIYLLLPLAFGGLVHGLSMKYGLAVGLAVPIDGGRTWRGKRLLGDNKTWRGVVVMALGTALGFAIQTALHGLAAVRPYETLDYTTPATWLVGAAIGAAGMLAELPNSFLKRRLGIGPGHAASGPWLAVFYVVDQIDLLAGLWLILSLAVPFDPGLFWATAGVVFFGHQLITLIGYALGMRKTFR
jgi:CDP-2,3-bis-(O-geranylgeranyl)-sn-glycerol synthase